MIKRRNLVNNMKYHYTYRITNIKERMYYYGVHSCYCLPEEEIGITYFSSSKNKEFKQDQKENPQDYKYKVIKQFNTRTEANYHEEILHAKFNVKEHKMFYNKHNACGKFDSTGMVSCVDKDGNKHYVSNKDHRFLSGELISTSKGRSKDNSGSKNPNYGKTTPQETRDKISYTLKNNGYTDSEETRVKKSISAKNRPTATKETRDKLSKINKGKQFSSETIEKMLATKRSREYGPNYNSLNVDIKNEYGEVIFSCLNNFCKICEENNLPGTALRNSIKTKKPIYINLDNGNLAKITNKGWIKYKGWIAELREISDE